MDTMFHRNIALIARGFNPWIGNGLGGFLRIVGHGLQIRASESLYRCFAPLVNSLLVSLVTASFAR